MGGMVLVMKRGKGPCKVGTIVNSTGDGRGGTSNEGGKGPCKVDTMCVIVQRCVCVYVCVESFCTSTCTRGKGASARVVLLIVQGWVWLWVVLVIKGKSTMQSRHYCFVRDGRGTSGVRKTLTAYGGKTYF